MLNDREHAQRLSEAIALLQQQAEDMRVAYTNPKTRAWDPEFAEEQAQFARILALRNELLQTVNSMEAQRQGLRRPRQSIAHLLDILRRQPGVVDDLLAEFDEDKAALHEIAEAIKPGLSRVLFFKGAAALAKEASVILRQLHGAAQSAANLVEDILCQPSAASQQPDLSEGSHGQ